ncbi:uncharacterized protein Z520_09511 [Fonsecaea multimorphosa CBS 102226]|uniref:Pre-mRNA-splicing factor 18 n=1 Tax=Fonsecaea multimorphosa CBS 102226 TaxID=1442371 RepID=A0A0D2ICE6_9EURO|nr:uncharacterized protein Z520_09511 [Fonsecaea multimorphosa CBS 102226]KIX94821.1 hypothetical protein Z520_09511 [Fonsecaea multimorphosa CBS 102226]OAL20399.1 hypothetical protein AYO22_08893 [Fonsecaea multimorphosa]
MDFKSLMSAQIAKSKPPLSKSPSSPSPTPDSPASTAAANKYVRRADLEASRQAEYLAEQARLSAEREERLAKKRKLEEEEAERDARREAKLRRLAEESRRRREEEEKEEERRRRKRLGLPEVPEQLVLEDGKTEKSEAGTGEIGDDIPDDELRKKLRQISEPATLFDEDYSARLKRYYSVTRKALTASSQKLSNGPIPTTLEPVEEKDMLLPSTLPLQAGTEEYTFLHRQLASYFTLLLTEWSHALAERDESVKQSSSGKAAYNNYLVVLKDLTPLFRHFEKQSLDSDLLEPICKIVRSAQKRRYVEANDEYLTLSIGKAAWPIGVTMVGIHERSAREKLHESSSGKQAHIMSDEVTRKFLQSIKRCISFAQTRWPPEDLGQLMG